MNKEKVWYCFMNKQFEFIDQKLIQAVKQLDKNIREK